MGHRAEAGVARPVEHGAEVPRRVAGLGRVESDGDDPLLEGERLGQRGVRGFGAEVPQEAQDQRRAHAELVLGVRERAVDARDRRLEGHAAVGVGLRIEEDLGVPDAVGVRPLEIGPGQVVEVALDEEHLRALVVDVEKVLQPGELVGPADLAHGAEAQRHPVALRDLEHQLRLERALDVQVQLGLGKVPNEVVHAQSRSGRRRLT